MAGIIGVLVVPLTPDPHNLITVGPEGYSPPTGQRCPACGVWHTFYSPVHSNLACLIRQANDSRQAKAGTEPDGPPMLQPDRGVVVAARGEPVWQGWTLIEFARGRGRDGSVEHALGCVLRHGTREALDHFRHRTCAGLGTVVYLDEIGMEVGE